MTVLQNIVIFALFGCVVYFPVLLVECARQHREIVRLRALLEEAVIQRKKTDGEARETRADKHEPAMWGVTTAEGRK